VAKNAVLTIDVSGFVSDRIPNDPFSDLSGTVDWSGLSREAVSDALKMAATDERIKAVWLKAGPVAGSWAMLEDIRSSIVRFKQESGKPVFASADDLGFNEASWYVASAADSIFAAPEALFELDGFYLESYFLKGMFDKLGIEPEIMRFGKYKSAVEPYILKEFSKENEEQLKPLLDVAARSFLLAAREVTGLDTAQVSGLMNEAPRITSAFAAEHGFIHGFAYPEQMEVLLKSASGSESKLNTISIQKYLMADTENDSSPQTDGTIALIYMNGMILPEISEDFGDASGISYEWFVRTIKQVEKNRNVKAVVLRIDSPGGSGSTSDLIWNRIRELKLKKPVIASVGDVAASGGYYIAMAADSIVIHPASITGSIGVFSTKFNASKLFEEKLGVTFDQVKTHRHADWFTVSKPLNDVQRDAFQKFQDDFYTTFIRRVAESRGMDAEAVHAVAQGRVWTGADAVRIGLVDEEGGLERALSIAAAKAGLQTWDVDVYPKRKTFVEALLAGDFAQLEARAVAHFQAANPAVKELEFLRFVAANQHRLNVLLPVTPEIR
jgi:protease-4